MAAAVRPDHADQVRRQPLARCQQRGRHHGDPLARGGAAIDIVAGTFAVVALGSSLSDPGSPASIGSLGAVALLAVGAWLVEGSTRGPRAGDAAQKVTTPSGHPAHALGPVGVSEQDHGDLGHVGDSWGVDLA